MFAKENLREIKRLLFPLKQCKTKNDNKREKYV